jgi:hypothetical protein
MNRIFATLERLFLAVAVILLIFFSIYVYGFGKVRGPLAREEFYKYGEVGQKAVTAEKARIEGEGAGKLKPATGSADTTE